MNARIPAPISPVEDIIADLRAARMVILIDEEDRENEGDLILAADHVSAQAINFMARFGRGLICLTLTRERCNRLQLPILSFTAINLPLDIDGFGVEVVQEAEDSSRQRLSAHTA